LSPVPSTGQGASLGPHLYTLLRLHVRLFRSGGKGAQMGRRTVRLN